MKAFTKRGSPLGGKFAKKDIKSLIRKREHEIALAKCVNEGHWYVQSKNRKVNECWRCGHIQKMSVFE